MKKGKYIGKFKDYETFAEQIISNGNYYFWNNNYY